jgi:hypothetical protein
MINVSSSDYLTIVRAAKVEAARLGVPRDGTQSVAVVVSEEAASQSVEASEPNAEATRGRVVNITI